MTQGSLLTWASHRRSLVSPHHICDIHGKKKTKHNSHPLSNKNTNSHMHFLKLLWQNWQTGHFVWQIILGSPILTDWSICLTDLTWLAKTDRLVNLLDRSYLACQLLQCILEFVRSVTHVPYATLAGQLGQKYAISGPGINAVWTECGLQAWGWHIALCSDSEKYHTLCVGCMTIYVFILSTYDN